MAAAYSVSIMTRWSGEMATRAWLKQRLGHGSAPHSVMEQLGAWPISNPSATGQDAIAEGLTPFGVSGPWSERLCHFRPDCDPGDPAQIQSEYIVPRANAVAAMERLRGIGARIDRHLVIGEIRSMAGDELWLSPAYGGAAIGLHFTWKREQEAVDAISAEMEELLLPLGARPHWGKLLHASARQMEALYPRLPEFRELARKYDPSGKFRNEFLDRHVFGG